MALTAPTKGNLAASKRSRSLAADGYDLMDKKRNILIREIMARIDEAAALQEKIDSTFADAYMALELAEVAMGGSVAFAAQAVPVDNKTELRYKSVMGVELPCVISPDEPAEFPPYGLAFTCPEIDEAYFRFVEVKKLLREMAEVENTIYRLAWAIKKAQKRANALQNIVIPRLDADISRISEALEEKEREEFNRLKVVKEQKGRQS